MAYQDASSLSPDRMDRRMQQHNLSGPGRVPGQPIPSSFTNPYANTSYNNHVQNDNSLHYPPNSNSTFSDGSENHSTSSRNLNKDLARQTSGQGSNRAAFVPGNSKSKILQIAMGLIAVAALALSMQSYKNLSSGILWGSALSFFSVVMVILSYMSDPLSRQHPNPLVFWRTIADSIFVIRLLMEQFIRCTNYDCLPLCNVFKCGCATLGGNLCVFFAGVFQFSLLASECWFVCMTWNLFLSLANPFTDFKRNTKLFHLFSWGFGLFTAIILMSGNELAGYSDLGTCWTNAVRVIGELNATCTGDERVSDILKANKLNVNMGSWAFFYIWIVIFIVLGLGVWIWAWRRLSEGMPETYAVRVQSITRARFIVIAVTIYWAVVLAVYISIMVLKYSKKGDQPNERLNELLNFFIAAKGYLDLVIWFHLNDFRVPKLSALWKKSSFEVDVDLNPQVNAALRREVLFYTTSGIIQAVQAAEKLASSQKIQHLALLPQDLNIQTDNTNIMSNTFEKQSSAVFDASKRLPQRVARTKTFHDYEPHAFKRIRERFGVDNTAYLNSLSSTAKERLSEGASGAFMFFSGDGSLIVKSTSSEECRFLRSIADQYADYLCLNPTSLLTRFYGCHCLELYGKNFSFVVMANLFDTKQVIHSRYDIKGSWVNRKGDLPKRGKKVTCRHCNRKYIYQSTAFDDFNCPLRLGGHEPNIILKDNDLTQKLNLDVEVALELYTQLENDSNLLCDFGIMDYSLLMGSHDVEFVVDPEEDQLNMMDNTLLSTIHSSTSMSNSIENESNQINPFSESSVLDPRSATAPALQPKMPPSIPLNVSGGVSGSSSSNLSQQPSHRNPKSRINRIESTVSSTSSGRRLPRSGMRLANTVVGPAYYHIGIIDILQTWTFSKKLERFFKVAIKRVDGDGLSAVPADLYKKRFQAKMADILGVSQYLVLENNTNGVDEEIFATVRNNPMFMQQNSHMDLEPAEISNVEFASMRSLANNSHLITGLDHHKHQPISSSQDSAHSNNLPNTMKHRINNGRSITGSQSLQEDYTSGDFHL